MGRKKTLPGSITYKPAGPRAPERWVFRGRNGTDPHTGKPRWDVQTFYSEGDAVEYDAQHSLKTAKGALSGRSARMTVAEAINEWAEMQSADLSSVSDYLQLLQPVKDAYGSHPVRRLHRTQLARLAHQLHTGTCPYKTPAGNLRSSWCADRVNKMLSRMESVLEGLRNEGFLEANHAALVPRIRNRRAPGTPGKRETFTLEDTSTIMEAAAARSLNLYGIVLLGFLGLREGEVAGLGWENVDFTGCRLVVTEQRKRNRRKPSERAEGETATYVDTVKTEASERDLPLPPSAVSALKVIRQWQREMHLATGKRWGVDGGLPTTVVANERTGKPCAHNYPWQRWVTLVTGLPVGYLKYHASRKTAATLVASQPGILPHHVGAWLGHESQGAVASPVTGLYIDADEEFRQMFADAWEVVFGPIVTKCDMLGAYERAKAQLIA
ncbi:hypothetical protein [Nocardia wallacei]|uniref:hypothetical protein n=1 Tax=Nocardia wallacei TaxID=480035 RepID=UPI002456BF1C|nr:hypothetical protein [Nocardia wallacei]